MKNFICLILILSLTLFLAACNTPDTPTEAPTTAPTEAPASKPTEAPTQAPTENKTDTPTETPTENNADAPTQAPTENNTENPTEGLTEGLTEGMTEGPTEGMTEGLTEAMTEGPTAENGTTGAPTENNTEAPTEDQYVTVREIVDEVFAGIDFDANIKGTIETLFKTKMLEKMELAKVLAFDYEIGTDGKFAYYFENFDTSINKSKVLIHTVNADTTKLQTYLEMSKDFEGYIASCLEENNLDFSSTVMGGAADEIELRSKLNNIKSQYLEQKSAIEATNKQNIMMNILFASPTTLTDAHMAELGITDYNAFANMLLTNQNTEGLDQVTGWTMEDVIATYISDFSAEGIDYSSGANILVVTNAGIYQYEMRTVRSYGDTTDRYSMLLNDSEKTRLKTIEQKAIYSENAVVYDENGERINDNDTYSSSEYAK